MVRLLDNVLSDSELAQIRSHLASGAFEDGRRTNPAAYIDKRNEQLAPNDAAAVAIREIVQGALNRNRHFAEAAFPKAITHALISRYTSGMRYGPHVDRATMTAARVRSDLSCTIFLAAPDEYDGGELVLETGDASIRLKSNAGSAVLYPATMVHYVTEVTRGARLAAVFWVQSFIADPLQREILGTLTRVLEQLRRNSNLSERELVDLDYVQANISRLWIDA